MENPVFVKAEIKSQRFTLPNGLDVVLHPDSAARGVVVNVRYDVGSKDDPAGLSGLAHLVEHLTFRRKPDGVLDAFSHLESAGSNSHNAGTSPDYTEYHARVPATELPLALWIEAARMAHPMDGIDDVEFFTERGVVRNELRQHVENVPYGHLDEAASAAVFGPDHPYSRSTIGSDEDLQAAKREDAVAFTSKHYRPNNATLVVAGAFDSARARALIQTYFSAVPPAEVPSPMAIALPTPEKTAKTTTVTLETGVDGPAVTIAWLVPPAGFRGWAEMKVAASELGGYVKYRMRSHVRVVRAELDSRSAGSVLLVHVELDPEGSVSDVLSWIDDELEAMEDGDVSIGDAKARIIASETLELEDMEDRASTIQSLVSRYDDPNGFQQELHAISEVTKPSFRSAVHTFLRGSRVVAIAKPTPGAPRAGRRAQ